MIKIYITNIEVLDEYNIKIADIEMADEESFVVKTVGLMTPDDLREIADLLEKLEKSGGLIKAKSLQEEKSK